MSYFVNEINARRKQELQQAIEEGLKELEQRQGKLAKLKEAMERLADLERNLRSKKDYLKQRLDDIHGIHVKYGMMTILELAKKGEIEHLKTQKENLDQHRHNVMQEIDYLEGDDLVEVLPEMSREPIHVGSENEYYTYFEPNRDE